MDLSIIYMAAAGVGFFFAFVCCVCCWIQYSEKKKYKLG